METPHRTRRVADPFLAAWLREPVCTAEQLSSFDFLVPAERLL